jgi:hypothetical protein
MSDIVKFGKLETMRFHSFEFLKLSLHCAFYSNSENIWVPEVESALCVLF